MNEPALNAYSYGWGPERDRDQLVENQFITGRYFPPGVLVKFTVMFGECLDSVVIETVPDMDGFTYVCHDGGIGSRVTIRLDGDEILSYAEARYKAGDYIERMIKMESNE